MFRATFPAGTLSGAPKPRALEIIDELEPAQRGLYGGVVGYFGFGGDADLAIAIRTATISGGVARVQAGGGLVADSVPESEFQESQNKAAAPLRAVAVANAMRRVRVTAARMKLPVIVATIIGSALALLSWSQTWFELELTDASAQGAGEAIAVPGSVASPALAALGLAGLALVAALAIAGPGIRIVLGVLEVVLGGCVLLAAGVSIGDPVAAVAPAVTDATGVSGSGPTAELVAAADRHGVARRRHRRGSPARARRDRGARHRHPLAHLVPPVSRRAARRRRRRSRGPRRRAGARHPIAPSTTGTS